MGRFSIVTWLLVGGLGVTVLFLFATPGCGCSTKSMAYAAAMKSDLRNLVTAQEARFQDDSTYARQLSRQEFLPSTAVTIRIIHADRNGHSAEARHRQVDGRCVIYVGRLTTLPTVERRDPIVEGEPACDANVGKRR